MLDMHLFARHAARVPTAAPADMHDLHDMHGMYDMHGITCMACVACMVCMACMACMTCMKCMARMSWIENEKEVFGAQLGSDSVVQNARYGYLALNLALFHMGMVPESGFSKGRKKGRALQYFLLVKNRENVKFT